MPVFRCPNCGAKVKAEKGVATAVCEYCGSEMSAFESTTEFEIDTKGNLVQYNGRGGDVIIPDGVLSIGDNCFLENRQVFTVKLPDTVKKIGASSFSSCIELEAVNIPDSVEEIGHNAFYKCSNLKEIRIPDSVFSLEKSTFCYCNSLKTVELGNGLRRIFAYVFFGCKSLESLVLPETLKSIGYQAFSESGIKNIILPANLNEIGEGCFLSCNALKSITLDSSHLKEIPENCFKGCNNLVSISLPDTVVEIKEGAFYKCAFLQNVSLSAGLEKIGKQVFFECGQLKSVTKTDSIEEIGDYCFEKCISLKNFVFPPKLRLLGIYAFSSCSSLVKIWIGANLKAIPDRAFYECLSLSEVSFSSFYRENEGLTSIGAYAFHNCKSLSSINIPDTVESIGEFALSGCGNIQTLRIPGSVKVVKDVLYNTAVECLYFEYGVQTIDDGLYKVKEIHFPTSIISISCVKPDNSFCRLYYQGSFYSVDEALPSYFGSLFVNGYSWKIFSYDDYYKKSVQKSIEVGPVESFDDALEERDEDFELKSYDTPKVAPKIEESKINTKTGMETFETSVKTNKYRKPKYKIRKIFTHKSKVKYIFAVLSYFFILPLPLVLLSGVISNISNAIDSATSGFVTLLLLPIMLILALVSLIIFYLGKIPAMLVHLIIPVIDFIAIANEIFESLGYGEGFFNMSILNLFS